MNCYVCDNDGHASGAVAVCQHCGAALCRDHLDQELLTRKPSGLAPSTGCSHGLRHAARERREDSGVATHATPGPDARVPVGVR